MTDNGWTVVGRLALARRKRLGLGQDDLKARGGPGVSTVGKIERGAQESFPLRTQQQVEDALGWPRRTIEEVLAMVASGEWETYRSEYEESLVEDDVPDLSEPPEPVRRAVDLGDAELLAELTYRVRQYAEAAARAPGPASWPDVVAQELGRRGKDVGWLLDASGLEADELAPFLESGGRPSRRVAKGVEKALGWAAGTLSAGQVPSPDASVVVAQLRAVAG